MSRLITLKVATLLLLCNMQFLVAGSTVDLGKMRDDKVFKATFDFENTSGKDLDFKSVKPSCSCIRKITPDTDLHIAPGARQKFDLEIHLTGRNGRFDVSLILEKIGVNALPETIQLTGEIVPRVQMQKDATVVSVDEGKTKEVRIPLEVDSVKLSEVVESNSSLVKARLINEGGEEKLAVAIEGSDLGDHYGVLTLKGNPDYAVSFPFNWTVTSPDLQKPSISLGLVKTNEKQVVELHVRKNILPVTSMHLKSSPTPIDFKTQTSSDPEWASLTFEMTPTTPGLQHDQIIFEAGEGKITKKVPLSMLAL